MHVLFCNINILDEISHNIVDLENDRSAYYFTSRPTSFFKRIILEDEESCFNLENSSNSSSHLGKTKTIKSNFFEPHPNDLRVSAKGTLSLFFVLDKHEIEFAQVHFFLSNSFDSDSKE